MYKQTHHAMAVAASRAEDLPLLAAIEQRAATLFATHPSTAPLGLAEGAPRNFAPAHAAGMLWVARVGERPAGFALVEPLEGGWHLEEMDVDPAYARRGIGTALVCAVLDAAASSGVPRLTLCTFREVPWNAPFYARLGFHELEEADCGPDLRVKVREEAVRGLPARLRVVMARDVCGGTGAAAKIGGNEEEAR